MRLKRKDGFTLLEVLVAVAILGIVVVGIATTFKSQVSSMYVQETVTDLQVSGSLVLMKVAQELRMAGYGVPKDNAVGAPAAVIAATDNDNTAGGADSVTIRYCTGASAYYYGTTPGTTFPLSSGGFTAGETVKVLNLHREDVFPSSVVTVVSFDTSDNTITLSSPLTGAPVPTDLGVFVGEGIADIRYEIANPGTDNVFLRRIFTPLGGSAQSEVVAFGVEDLQVAYGLDEDGNGAVDTFVSTPTTSQLPRVIAIRLSVIVRSPREDGEGISGVVQAENGNPRGGADRYKRRIYSTTMRLRNASVI